MIGSDTKNAITMVSNHYVYVSVVTVSNVLC